MKKIFFLFSLLGLTIGGLIAQSPNSFKYQAVARNSNAQVLNNQNISMRFSILEDAASGNAIYVEEHDLTTTDIGVFALQIGAGSVQSGSMSDIDWANHSYFMKVEMDSEGGSNFVEMGTSALLSVPYALHAATATDTDDADADPDNEIQALDFDSTSKMLSLSDGGEVDLSPLQDGTEDADADPANEIQSLTFNPSNNELSISNGNSITIPSGGTDADPDPNNEIQTISKNGSTVTLSNNGGSFIDDVNDQDADPSNEIQSISFNTATNQLSISDGNTITIPAGGTDADADPSNEIQTLSQNGLNVSLSANGGTINIADNDNDSNNELQNISFDTNTNELSISDGNTITIPSGGTDADADPMNELQTLSLTDTQLSITNGNTVDLAVIMPLENQDDQNLNLNGTDLSIENGNVIDLSLLQDGVDDADADPSNELQTISKNGNTISLSNNGGSITDAVDDADADATNELQTLSFDPNTNELSIANGNSISIPSGGSDADADPNNEIQSLSFDPNTNQLSISNGNSVSIPTGGSDADADPSNELQTLSQTGLEVSLSSNGGTINVADNDNDDSNEIQDINLNGTDLSIDAGSTVDLSVLQDGVEDADADPGNEIQILELNGTVLDISGVNSSVDLVAIQDGVEDADADATNELQTLSVTGSTLAISGGNDVIIPSSKWGENNSDIYFDSGNVGIGTDNPTSTLTLEGQDQAITVRSQGADSDARISLWLDDSALSYFSLTAFDENATGTIPGAFPRSKSLLFFSGSALDRTVFQSAGPIHWQVASAPSMTFNTDGQLGIGTKSPQRELHMTGDDQRIWLEAFGTNNNASLYMTAEGDNDNYLKMSVNGSAGIASFADGTAIGGAATIDAGPAADKLIINSEGGPLHMMTAGQTGLYMNMLGQIGMGTTNPQRELHMKGEDQRIWLDSDGNNNSSILAMTVEDNESKYLRIGMNPSQNFVAYNDGTNLSNAAFIDSGGDAEAMLINCSHGNLALLQNGTTKILLHDNGNTGFGTYVPAYDYHFDDEVFFNTTSGNVRLGKADANQWSLQSDGSGDNLFLMSGSSGGSFQHRFSFMRDGRLGIHNINPNNSLTVGENFGPNWIAHTISVGGGGSGGNVQMGDDDRFLRMLSTDVGADAAIIEVGGNSSNGNLGIIGTGISIGSQYASSDVYPLRLVQSVGYGLNLQTSDASHHWEQFVTGTGHFRLYANGAYLGNFDATSGAYTSTSDKRLKENINPLESVLSSVMKLQASKYDYIKRSSVDKKSIGFIAQDVQKLFPELVHESTEKRSEGILTMNYAGFGVIAVKAIQEQQEIIDEQAAKIDNLETRLSKLEAMMNK